MRRVMNSFLLSSRGDIVGDGKGEELALDNLACYVPSARRLHRPTHRSTYSLRASVFTTDAGNAYLHGALGGNWRGSDRC